MNIKGILDCVTIDDLPAGFDFIAECCGLDVAKKLIENVPGCSFYVPKQNREEIITPYIMKFIQENITVNKAKIIRMLVKETNTSQRTIKRILTKLVEDGKLPKEYNGN